MMRRRSLWIIAAVVVVVGVGVWWEMDGHAASPAANATSDTSNAAKPAPLVVPVATQTAQVRDVPVFLDGLGTVKGFKTVQIRAQVTGILEALPAKEGQEVHQGDIVAQIDSAPYKAALDAAVAQRSEDEAQLQSAQLDLHRYQSLAKSSYAPVQQVDDQQATVSKDNAAVSGDEARIETAQINLGYCVIRAPFDGRISLYQLDVGNLVTANGTSGIISIQQDKPIAVVMTLPEDQLQQVQDARARGPVLSLAYDSTGQTLLARGTLLTPNNAIDTSTGTISLKSSFPNTDDHLWPGQFVNVRLQVDTLKKAVTVPSLAVQHGPSGLFVYVAKPDGTAAQVMIDVGYQDNGLSVVTKGLRGTEAIVLSGQSRLAPGAHIKATVAKPVTPTAEAAPNSTGAPT
jgi:multidrug efflux system membrane fusion protein